jgi:hypothetical protein
VKEKANFDLEGSVAEDPEDELDLIVIAEQNTHIYAIFNHAYTGTTTLTIIERGSTYFAYLLYIHIHDHTDI